jgi:glycosyltransferase involved in cell wall biosynthesis
LYQFFLSQTIKRADFILTDSKTSQRDIADRFPKSSSKMSFAYAGYNLIPSPSPLFDGELLNKFGISGTYLAYLGGFEKRKAVEALLAAFPMIRSKHKIQLVLVGKKNEYFRRSLAQWQGPDIVFTDYLPDNTMLAVLRHAAALVYPTRYEGFGLPMVEAMALGVPVIARNASVMREIGTGAALLLDTVNPSTLAQACNTLLADPALRERYRLQGIQRAQRFSWTDTVIAAEQAYHHAYTIRHPNHE